MKTHQKHLSHPISATGVALLVTIALGGFAGSAMAQAIAVPTVALQAKAVGATTELEGVVQAVRQSTLAAQTSGRIATLLVKAGDTVKAGQLIATIDNQESAAGVQKSQAYINQADAELRNARMNLERTQDLQNKGYISKAALDTADAQFKGATAVREQATAAARQSGVALGFSRVSAPYDGFVLQVHAEAGDLALPGKPLLTLYAPQPLRVAVQVPASKANTVGTALQTRFAVDSAPGAAQWMTPILRSAVPAADPVSQTTEWRLGLSAQDSAKLVPGQQVRVQFAHAQANPVPRLLVPEAAVLHRGELTAVYVVVNKSFALRAVRLGTAFGADGIEVQAGVKAGDVVALDPIRAGFTNATPAGNAK